MQLAQLQNSKSIEKFSEKVVEDVKAKLDKEISTNEGLNNEDELLKLIKKGKSVKFSYDILVKDSEEL